MQAARSIRGFNASASLKQARLGLAEIVFPRIRGFNASASLKRHRFRQIDAAALGIRGFNASASLKPRENWTGKDMFIFLYPRL